VLKLRIGEIIEKFPKLSGLTGLQAKNLCIKSEKGLLPILSDEIMGNSIKSKDTIIFELEFSEIWLEVEMTLQSEDKSLKISFELKVAVDFFISHMKDILIKMGIKSWAKYILDNEDAPEDYDYYLFSNFILIFSDKEGNVMQGEIELDNFNGKNLKIIRILRIFFTIYVNFLNFLNFFKNINIKNNFSNFFRKNKG
jgi:hypothetical protein